MIDGLFEFVVSALAALAAVPLGFFFPCNPCCGGGCGVADGKPRTDPANEGTWAPSGVWIGGSVTWTFTANPGDDSGNTWFFYGSASTSKDGGSATLEEQQDWGNICNWYSSKTTSPSSTSSLASNLNKRASSFPPQTAIVHFYTNVTTENVGAQTIKSGYFWSSAGLLPNSNLTATDSVHDSSRNCIFVSNGRNSGTISGGALFINAGTNSDIAVINGGASFGDNSDNLGTVNGGAEFFGTGANSRTLLPGGGQIDGVVNGGATFNDNATNFGTVNGGATFNDNSRNVLQGTVNNGATFNDNACSNRNVGDFYAVPCTRKWVAHPTDLPICNGTAPDGCNSDFDVCGCG